MPELPEVETVRRGLEPVMVGQTIAEIILRRPNLRVPFPPGLQTVLNGCKIMRLSRRAKYLLVHMDGGQLLVLHLGMSGQMTALPTLKGYDYLKHDHMVIVLKNGAGIVFNDARRFGMVHLMEEGAALTHPVFHHLGPEPLSNHFSAPGLLEKLRKKTIAIKPAIMDQEIVVGVGNIYASEALHDCGISPLRPASELKPAQAEKLVASIRQVLARAIEAGGSTLRDYRKSDGSLGYFQHSFSVYDKAGEACERCAKNGKKGIIQKIVQAGRATYYCPKCQK
jgi:formamidopyrimidine-DNA glycosylase